MIAGIPGTGIGGLFYLLITLWMPFRELYLVLRKRSRPAPRRVMRQQLCMSLGLITGMWGTGELIAQVLRWAGLVDAQNFLHRASILVTLGVLIVVYLTVHLIRVSVHQPVAGTAK
jgi:hypothetical protein